MYGHTVAIIEDFNGFKGCARDGLGLPIYFTVDDVHPHDIEVLKPGVQVIYTNQGLIEVATSSFIRFAYGEVA